MAYTVQNVKSFRGREGYGFNADLLRDGKRVALVIDSGNGGCYRYEWNEMGDAEKKAFVAFCAADPRTKDETFERDDRMVAILVDEAEALKVAVKRLKKGLMFKDGDRLAEVSFKKATPEKAREYVKTKYPNAVIINDLPIEEAVKLLVRFA